MAFLFGKAQSPGDLLKKNKRMIDRAIRDLDRERVKLQQAEKKTIADIKKAARDNQVASAKIMAKDLVRSRKHITKFYQMQTHLKGVSLKLATLKSNQAMSEAMKGATRAMTMMNAQMNMPQMQAVMRQFQMQDEQLEMKQEMMEDVMDDMDADGDEDEEADGLVDQIFEEIGLGLGEELGGVAMGSLAPEPAATEADVDTLDLEARLEQLRRG